MATSDEDPIYWDVDKVVHELCTASGRPWHPRSVTKRPSAAALSKALVDHDVDGETLLTYEDVMSSITGLLQILGLEKPAHQMTLVRAIKYLQSKSAGYQQFKSKGSFASPSSSQQEQVSPGSNSGEAPSDALSLQPNGTSLSGPTDQITQHEADGEPAPKKRKLAPVLISTEVSERSGARIPNAADGLTLHFPRTNYLQSVTLPAGPDESASDSLLGHGKTSSMDVIPGAYFGRNALVTADQVPSSNLQPNDDDDENHTIPRNFCIISAGLVPAGRRNQIFRAIRGLYLKNNRAHTLMREGMAPYVEPDEGEKILPVFGDSDSEEEYDSDTRQEIEDEQEDIRLEKERKMHQLTSDDVDRIMHEEIARMEEDWDEWKLPIRERKAKRIWNRPGRRSRIQQASAEAKAMSKRIDKLCAEVQHDEWQSEQQLRRQMQCFEATVRDRKEQKWLLSILLGPEPLGPETMPKICLPAARREVLSDEDGELIMSDESEDDFVIDDTKGIAASSEPSEPRPTSSMDLDHPARSVEPEQGLRDHLTSTNVSARMPDFFEVDSPIIDLTRTDSEPVAENREVISLLTPTKDRTKDIRLNTEIADEETMGFSEEELDIPFDRPADIAAIPSKIWKERNDCERLLIGVLWTLDRQLRNIFFELVCNNLPSYVWDSVIAPVLDKNEEHSVHSGDIVNLTAQLFRVFVFCKSPGGKSLLRRLKSGRAKKLKAQQQSFEAFCSFAEEIRPHFTVKEDISNEECFSSTDAEKLSGDDVDGSPSKRRKRIIVDKAAKDLREKDVQRLQEQEKRRQDLRKKLAASDAITSNESRLIINETKQDDQGLIYVNEDIGKRIKDHQIRGVRFMWNQIMCDPQVRQGCLLAHTMGLGKTMQVITLLVAIAETSQSEDESIRSQIPPDLRQSKTLILCPALLVDNWMDEMLIWAPTAILGQYFKLEAITDKHERIPLIRQWDAEGGVLIIGYDMFKRLIDQPGQELPQANDAKTAWEILTKSPNIVIADEAHKLKNPESQVGLAAAQFRTQSRIALTGSPLANNVEEFYWMINWVAPHYLGPPSEFRELYAIPIQNGLYEDSSFHQFRKAKKQLSVLEKTVEPKVNRATVKTCLGNGLPPKTEFILTVPLTDLQGRLYDDYIVSTREAEAGRSITSTPAAISNLALIVNHPRCWRRKLLDERSDPQPKLPSRVISAGLKMVGSVLDIQSPTLSWKTRLLIAILDESRELEDKVLIFTHSILTLDYLESLFRSQKRKIARLDGNTKISRRQQDVKDFNAGDTQIYLISTTAGGVGLNIFGANRVVLFDFKYNPVHEQQAVGRAYRIGQQKPVYVYKFISGGTFEASMQNRAVFKTQLASRVVDKENPKRWSKKDHEFLQDRTFSPQQDVSKHVGKDSVLDSMLRDADLSKGILDVLPTDTFFEEDLDDVLTAEDKKEVDDQVRMNTLRLTNPDEFRRLEQEMLNRLHSVYPSFASGAGVPPSTSTSSPGLPRVPGLQTPIPPPNPWATGSNALAQQQKSLEHTIVGGVSSSATSPGQLAQASAHASSPNGAVQGETSHQQAPQLADGSTFSLPAVSSEGVLQQAPSEQAATAPMPMVGANTFFRNQPESTAALSGHIPLSGLNGPRASATKTPKRSTLITWPNQFEQKILESLNKMTDPDVLHKIREDHQGLARRIAEKTWQERVNKKEGEFPDDRHMKKLCGLMENSRFAAAVALEHLTYTQLARTDTFKGLDDLEKEWTELDEQQFRERLRLGSNNTTQDHNILRGDADRRTHRLPRLPSWATRAVEEGKLGEPRARPRDPFQPSPSPSPSL
ncbi:snf2 family helicase [Colletotrichum musicola]|uniref:Snf2 family helicase n=1 Tax=Colletotrichum musicola TaxID=2175873 RepID=A0A8H6NVG3_9PEZI|nr:snf2 family helicase [Colletotrichum musicola]